MSPLIKSLLATTLTFGLLGTQPARATAYTYTETFDNGTDASANPIVVTATGSFDGTANGNLITGLSNVTFLLNGVAPANPGSLFLVAFNNAGFYDSNAILSFDGLHNNVLLSNSPDPASTFPSIAFSSFTGVGVGNPDIAYDPALTGYNNDPTPTRLLITEAAAIPEPASATLLLAGTIGAWLIRRRRPT